MVKLGPIVLVRRGPRWGVAAVVVVVVHFLLRSLPGVGVQRLLLHRGRSGRGSCNERWEGRGQRRRWVRPRGGWRGPMERVSLLFVCALFAMTTISKFDGLILLRFVIYVTNTDLCLWIFGVFRIQCYPIMEVLSRNHKPKSRQLFYAHGRSLRPSS